jgi:hypothetical protein
VRLGLERWRSGSYRQVLREGTMPLPSDVQTLPLYLAERLGGRSFDPTADLPRLLPAARTATLAFWVLLLVYGWLAAWQVGGPWAARVGVALLASEPSLLAHASLATSDVAVAACLLALAVHFRRGREGRWLERVGIPALWFGAAVLAKASGLVLGGVVLVVAVLGRAGRAVWPGLRRDVGPVVGLGLVVAFLYCGTDWRAEPSLVAWARALGDGPLRAELTRVAERLRIFPNAGDGIVRQVKHNVLGHETYLLGRVHRRAVWYYFPVVLSLKLTLTLLALPLLVAACRPRALANWATGLTVALLILSLTFRVQLGVRFVLPLIVFASVGLAAASVAAARDAGPRWRRGLAVAVAAGVVWQAAAAVRVWPHGLTYANELWGGTAHAYRYVSDSNYDWGQGLPELARWQRERGLAELDIWYFGTDPALARLPMRQLGFDRGIGGPEDVVALVQGRYLAVSTTLLHGRLWTDSQRRAAAFLRARPPVARTTTYLIYDFTRAH